MTAAQPMAGKITPDQLGALTILVQAIRPEWDTRAIRPVLEQLAGHDLADLAHAAIRTAQDSSLRRPAAIAFDNHWRPTVREVETPADRDERIHQQRLDRADRERARYPDPTPYADAARAAIRPTRLTRPAIPADQDPQP